MEIPQISVRREPAGGPVAREAGTNNAFDLTTSRLIILIHGYNNSRDQALNSYEAFLKNSGLGRATVIGKACGFFWPGDRGGLLSMFSYPWEIEPARQSAAVLHEFLINRMTPGGWPLEIMLVCHSLGNRVGLELVNNSCLNGESGKIKFRAGCFMAAAVPVFKVEPGGDLRDAAEAVERRAVLYSEKDIVLHFAFPVGQTLAGEGEGFFPRAVGRFGQPSSGLWAQSSDMGQYKYNHGYYWDHPESANTVAAFLGLVVDRETPAVALAEREMLRQPEPAKRQIRERGIAGRALYEN